MKICLFGVPGASAGKQFLKDPRLDTIHKLVEADKKAYAAVEAVTDESLAEADAIAATSDSVTDLLLQDLEFVETRLGRGPGEAEKAVLQRMQAELEASRCLSACHFSEADWAAVSASGLITRKAVVVAEAGESIESLLLRAFAAGGYLSYLTVGGKENRAWPIRRGATAWEAAGAIHTDIQKGFIRAEVIAYADLVAAGGETQAKRAGKLRLETKQYVVQDYDVVNFRFNKT